MQPHPRYQVLDQIAVGDFATVFRGKDLELNRDVAIKQIHPQFLADQRQLERYWQEAQLLASLEHPNIMTIYDIARDRGWLILELMQGSLRDRAAGQPMDLNFLRVALVCALQALKFLHTNGIVHGDVKPSNMLLDKRNWVKLGDFGLAQRVVNDQGSLLKGTTKYMAPERVSDQFGPVGPQSDLYSLGFSIYELMCGDAFQTLFPGLGAFGRDQQIAWMMWQAAPDRQLPEIRRVLEGVPDDLIQVIQRLVTKDPRRRYQTADEAIRDLKSGMGYGPSPPSAEQLAAEAAARDAARRKKRRVMMAIAGSVLLLLGAAAIVIPRLIPPPPPPAVRIKELQGVVSNIFSAQKKVVLDTKDVVAFHPEDLVFLNDEVARFSDVKEGDRLAVVGHRDASGKSVQEIRLSRPQQSEGILESIEMRERTIVVTVGPDGSASRDITILIPEKVAIQFNGQSDYHGRPVSLADLVPGDRIVVQHDPRDKGRVATTLAVSRVVPVEGAFVLGFDEKRHELTFALGAGSNAPKVTLPLAPDCEVTINRKKFLAGRPIGPGDLRPGDEVALRHDTQVVSIAALRVVTGQGVLKAMAADGRSLSIQLQGEDRPKSFIVDGETTVRLKPEAASDAQVPAGNGDQDQFGAEKVPITELQTGDAVDIRFDSADPAHPVALEVEATRAIDRSRWAILIAEQEYRDAGISPLRHPRSDVARLREVLIKRYRVAPDQAVVIADVDRATLDQSLGAALKSIGRDAHLLVYVAGHAYRDSEGAVYLAATDFQMKMMKQFGLPLTRFFTLINGCPAADKVLILDTCQVGSGIDIPLELSPEKLVAMAKESTEQPLLTSVTVISSCQEGQRGLISAAGHGMLSDVLGQAFTGRADANGDHLVTKEELFEFVKNGLRTASAGRQSPVIIPPQQVVPPRLSPEAKQAIAQLAAVVLEAKYDPKKLRVLYDAAVKAAPKQPEPRTLYGLALLKDKKYAEAEVELLAVLREFPGQLVPLEGLSWNYYLRRNYTKGINALTELVTKLPRDKAGATIVDRQSEPLLEWAGRLRQFAGDAAADAYRPAATTMEKLDLAVVRGGDAAVAAYRGGQQHVRNVVTDFDKREAEASDMAERGKIRLERRRLMKYVTFSPEAAVQRILDGTRK